MFLVYWAYPIVCEALWGRTLGKRALGLRVLSRDGAPVGWMASITRNLLRTQPVRPPWPPPRRPGRRHGGGACAGAVPAAAADHRQRAGPAAAAAPG
ncbi:hypothetical protein G6F65_022663 [Rhizopus arrhizus]|nr:hypothetical protein G6F65_022663 [Rhizopus arrhizus]